MKRQGFLISEKMDKKLGFWVRICILSSFGLAVDIVALLLAHMEIEQYSIIGRSLISIPIGFVLAISLIYLIESFSRGGHYRGLRDVYKNLERLIDSSTECSNCQVRIVDLPLQACPCCSNTLPKWNSYTQVKLKNEEESVESKPDEEESGDEE